MSLLSDIQAIPVVDHHCHAGMDTYEDASGRLRDLRDHELAYARGFIESRIGADAYRRLLEAQRGGDAAVLAELEARHGLAELTERALRFRSTTAFAHSLEEGIRRLHGTDAPHAAALRARDDEPLRDFYDRALDTAGCDAVYTDVRTLDRDRWGGGRYRWIMRIDAYLYPFELPRDPDRGEEFESFSARFRSDLGTRLAELGLDAPPAGFDEYLAFVDASIEQVIADGVRGFKIASAYTRSLRFQRRTHEEAAAAWLDARRGELTARTVYEDYLVFHIVRRIARTGLPIQIHVGSGHGEPGMTYDGVRPGNLQPLFSDPETSGSPIVLIHGGYPYSSETAIMAHTYGNVYLDFSWMPYLHRTYLTSRLNEWLEFLPANKVLFGSDTGLPELHVAAIDQARSALHRALERGRLRGLWAGAQAAWLAERVLRENTLDLYESNER